MTFVLTLCSTKFDWHVKNDVFPKTLIRNSSVKCLIFEKSSRKPCNDELFFFRALVVQSNGKSRLEKETSNFFAANLPKIEDVDKSKDQGVFLNDVATVENLPYYFLV